MKWMSLIIALTLMTACGNASFESSAASSEVAPGGDENGGQQNPGDPSMDGPKIPVKEILNDPTLLNKYPCPDGSGGVIICHFPEGGNGGQSQCIGKPAVYSHVDHYQDATGENDYLGACR